MNVYTCKERLTIREADQVREDLLKLIRRGDGVRIDMSNCSYISSAGIRTLIIAGKAAPKFGNGKLELFNVNDSIKEMLTKVGVNSLIKIE